MLGTFLLVPTKEIIFRHDYTNSILYTKLLANVRIRVEQHTFKVSGFIFSLNYDCLKKMTNIQDVVQI